MERSKRKMEAMAAILLLMGMTLIAILPVLRSVAVDGSSSPSSIVPLLDTLTTVMEPNTTTWDTAGIFSPFVTYDEGVYKMWYSTICEPTVNPPFTLYRFIIAYAESNDGVVWSNRTTVHDTGSASWEHTANPSVFKENGTYRMWHTDYYEWVAGDWSSYIAYMSSSDGVNWPAFMSADDVKVLSAQGQTDLQGDGYSIDDANVIREPSGYAMWYSVKDHPQTGVMGPLKIWRAVSTDGITWSNRQLSLPYVPDTWERQTCYASVAREDDGTYTMFYQATYANGSYPSIGMAESTDGINWANRTQFLKPSDLGVNITRIVTPFHFKDVDGKRYLYFSFYDESSGDEKLGRMQLSAPSSADWWPMFRHDPERGSYSPSKAPNTNNTLWAYRCGLGLTAYFAVCDGMAFISSDNTSRALDATTGQLIWNTTTPFTDGSVAVAYYTVFIQDRNGMLYTLDEYNGSLKWNFSVGTSGCPAVADKMVFATTRELGIVYALDAITGTLRWSRPMGYTVYSSPTVDSGMVFVATWGEGKVYALNESTGSTIWSSDALTPMLEAAPVAVDGRIYMGGGDGVIYVLDEDTGVLTRTYGPVGGYLNQGPVVAYGKLFVGTDDSDRTVYAIDESTGSTIWSYYIGGGWGAMHEPVVADHKIFVGSSTPPPGLYVFNESSGSLIWSFQTPSSDFTSVVSIANGMVFAGIGNTFYAFGPLGTDLNRDGKVNIVDISIVARAFGSREGDPNWNVIADLNKDGIVNILDIAAVAKDYGKTT